MRESVERQDKVRQDENRVRAEGEREAKLPTKGSGRQSRKHMVSERICAMHFMGMQAVDGHSPNSIILLDAKFKTYAGRVDSRLLGI